MTDQFLKFMDALPEAESNLLLTVLREFFDTARQATCLSDVNVAAGVALEKLS